MRHVAPLLLALAACADDPGPPTYPDLIGTWAVEWTCFDGDQWACPTDASRGPMLDSTSVTIGAHSEVWWNSGTEHASDIDSVCAVVQFGADGRFTRSAYAICARPDGNANIPGVSVEGYRVRCDCLAALTRL